MPHRLSLYLVRHAIADARGAAYPDDSKRPLTEDGVAKFKKAARALRDLDVHLDRILTSPFVRARQTADVLAAALDRKPPIVETAALEPGTPFPRLLAELARQADCAALALVGHEPGIGEAAGRLIGAHALEFRKGAVCRIDFDAWPPMPPGVLRWFVTPKMLRAITE